MNYKFRLIAGLSVWLGLTTCLAVAGEEAQAPPEITPPAGNVLFLATEGAGTQNYICLPSSSGGASTWAFFSPQATLSVPFFGRLKQQVATHFLSPVPGISGSALPGCTVSPETNEVNCVTWQSSFDSSAVWGEREASLTAGSDPSCPDTGAIACLLVKAVATRHAAYGDGTLGQTTYIQRLHTVGGAAPAGSCTVGDQALVPYRANYLFYKAGQE